MNKRPELPAATADAIRAIAGELKVSTTTVQKVLAAA
jgi:hypothetical protein